MKKLEDTSRQQSCDQLLPLRSLHFKSTFQSKSKPFANNEKVSDRISPVILLPPSYPPPRLSKPPLPPKPRWLLDVLCAEQPGEVRHPKSSSLALEEVERKDKFGRFDESEIAQSPSIDSFVTCGSSIPSCTGAAEHDERPELRPSFKESDNETRACLQRGFLSGAHMPPERPRAHPPAPEDFKSAPGSPIVTTRRLKSTLSAPPPKEQTPHVVKRASGARSETSSHSSTAQPKCSLVSPSMSHASDFREFKGASDELHKDTLCVSGVSFSGTVGANGYSRTPPQNSSRSSTSFGSLINSSNDSRKQRQHGDASSRERGVGSLLSLPEILLRSQNSRSSKEKLELEDGASLRDKNNGSNTIAQRSVDLPNRDAETNLSRNNSSSRSKLKIRDRFPNAKRLPGLAFDTPPQRRHGSRQASRSLDTTSSFDSKNVSPKEERPSRRSLDKRWHIKRRFPNLDSVNGNPNEALARLQVGNQWHARERPRSDTEANKENIPPSVSRLLANV